MLAAAAVDSDRSHIRRTAGAADIAGAVVATAVDRSADAGRSYQRTASRTRVLGAVVVAAVVGNSACAVCRNS